MLWEPARHVALYGGRGGAKSRSVAKSLIIQARAGHRRVLCVREVQRSIKDSVKRLLGDEIERLGLSAEFHSTDAEIRGPNDSLFIFAGLRGNASGIKSYEGITDCWPEEAQNISQGSIDTLIPTIRRPGSRLVWTWNPDLPTDPVDVLFRDERGPPPDTIVRCVNYDENPWFPGVLRTAMEHDRIRDPDKYNHIWRGQYRANSEARVFRNWTVAPFEAPSNAVFRFGADWGFSVDPTVLVRCFIGRYEGETAIADERGRHLFFDYEAYEVGCDIARTPALFDTVPESRAWPIVADSARPETISHMKRNGFPKMASAIKGARSIEEGVEFMKGYDIVVHPRCQHVIDDMTLYSFEVDPLTGSVIPKLADKSNNCIDAARYALEGARRAANAAMRSNVTAAPIPSMRTGFNSR